MTATGSLRQPSSVVIVVAPKKWNARPCYGYRGRVYPGLPPNGLVAYLTLTSLHRSTGCPGGVLRSGGPGKGERARPHGGDEDEVARPAPCRPGPADCPGAGRRR